MKAYAAGKIAAITRAVAAVIEISLAIFSLQFLLVRRRRHDREIGTKTEKEMPAAAILPHSWIGSSQGG